MTDFSNQRFALDAQSWWNGKAGRMVIRGGVIVLLLVAGGAIALLGEHLIGGSAPANEVRVTPYQDWRVVCQPAAQAGAPAGQVGTVCTLNSDVLRDTGGTLMSLVLSDAVPGKPLTITVPHGVLLAPGIGFSAGNEALKVRPYETCTNAGCFAYVNLDADMLKSLKSNMSGQVVVALPGSSSPATIPFSLKGFPEGYTALEREQSRRGSIFSFLSR